MTTLKEIGFLVEIYGHEEFSDGTVDKGTDGPKRAKERLLSAIRAVVEQRDRYEAALKAIVALDDGNSPDLWHYHKEFDDARDALASRVKECDHLFQLNTPKGGPATSYVTCKKCGAVPEPPVSEQEKWP